MVFMNESLYQRALDDILISHKYFQNENDEYGVHKAEYYIAQNKIYLGQYEDANKELIKCIDFFKKNAGQESLGKDYQTYYLYSLMSLIDSNTKIGKQKENKELLKEAYSYISNHNLNFYKPYFVSSEGTDAYFEKNYTNAIAKLSEAIRLYNDQWPHITEVYYIGLSHWKLGNRFTAVKYLEEVDKHYTKTKKLDPVFRPAYELLIKYNDSIGNKDRQLEYIDRLMVLDRSYEKNFKYLYAKINKDYDTKKLIAEKAKIEKNLKREKTYLIVLLLASMIGLGIYAFRYDRLQKTYKKRFDRIITEIEQKEHLEKIHHSKHIVNDVQINEPETELVTEEPVYPKISETDLYDKVPGIKASLVKNILSQLEEFENAEEFLDPQISQKMLSERFGTNSTYLSKVINVYKGKNFNIYINDLRLEYVVEHMKTDWNFLNKDVKELTHIAGFTNSENFSDNFQRKYQLKPSYFIKMMKENIRTSAQSRNQA